MCIGCALEIYIWLSNKVVWNIHIGDALNYLNSRCNTAKLLWVVIYVVCYGRFSPDLVVMNICRQRLIKVKSPLWQRSLANENAVVCRQGAMRWRLLSMSCSCSLWSAWCILNSQDDEVMKSRCWAPCFNNHGMLQELQRIAGDWEGMEYLAFFLMIRHRTF